MNFTRYPHLRNYKYYTAAVLYQTIQVAEFNSNNYNPAAGHADRLLTNHRGLQFPRRNRRGFCSTPCRGKPMADMKTISLTPPSMTGDNLYLKPATAKDIENTYHWYLMSDPQSTSPTALSFKTPAEAAAAFREQERSAKRERLMTVRRNDKTPVGWIDFFNLNSHNKSAELRLVIDPEERKKGYGLEAIELMCRYLFDSRGLNKVYVHTPAYSKGMIALLKKAGFQQDGVVRHHYLNQREFHDGFIYSLLRFEAKQ